MQGVVGVNNVFRHPALQNVVLESCPYREKDGVVVIDGRTYPVIDGYVNPPLPNISKDVAQDYLLDLVAEGVCAGEDIAPLMGIIRNYEPNLAYALRCHVRDVDKRNVADLLYGEWWLGVRQHTVDTADYIDCGSE